MNTADSPKKFYKHASVTADDAGFAICLDGRPIKTPAKVALTVPTDTLANAIADEWNAQDETLDLQAMTLTRLANVAIDRTPGARHELAAELVRYAGTDVTCYLAGSPTELQARQEAAWKPWRDWAGQELAIMLVPVIGLIASPQPEASLAAVRSHALALDDFRLTALSWSCSLLGSAVLALAMERGKLDAKQALLASCVDEDWQIEQWGQDDEAKAVRAGRARDADALQLWFEALH